jgi:hypothetical protein
MSEIIQRGTPVICLHHSKLEKSSYKFYSVSVSLGEQKKKISVELSEVFRSILNEITVM